MKIKKVMKYEYELNIADRCTQWFHTIVQYKQKHLTIYSGGFLILYLILMLPEVAFGQCLRNRRTLGVEDACR